MKESISMMLQKEQNFKGTSTFHITTFMELFSYISMMYHTMSWHEDTDK